MKDKASELEYVDLAIIAPLEEEANALFSIFSPTGEPEVLQDVLVTKIALGESGLSGTVVQLGDMGNQEAYQATKLIFEHYRVGAVICIGIAGGISEDLKLGDVCYSGTIVDVTDRQKVRDAKATKGRRGKGIELFFNTEFYRTPNGLQTSVTFSRTHQTLKKLIYSAWQAECTAYLATVLPGLKSSSLEMLFRESPITIHGKIACGAVSASRNYIEKLKDLDRKMLAIETESGGIFRAAQESGSTPALTIRGISDFADAQKRKLEESLKGGARTVATHNAVLFLRAQLSNPHFVSFVHERRRELTGEQTVDPYDEGGEIDHVRKALLQLSSLVESQLRELCPEYKVQPKGYVLPAPRITEIRVQGDPRNNPEQTYVELQEALTDSRLIVVDAPSSYPDKGLPWVIAENLNGAVVGEKQVVPLVLNGSALGPPHAGLAELSLPNDIDELSQEDGAQLVFVIYDLDLRSRSRTNFLVPQIDKYANAKFLVLSRGEGALVLQTEFVRATSAKPFALCDVPFIAISNFLQRNFSMPPVEAEVIALRLRNTFEKFNLSAHPTYFAGIPKETLIALLQANRRAELIQLAVDGFLTFLVAEDVELPLSRTTRRRFLSDLAVELEVHKRVFSESTLFEFAEAFAVRHDFELSPIKFIHTFISKGLIRLQAGQVEFTLPFIKHFLLAEALSKDAALAKRHFSLGEMDFDFETFDLYAEIGASDEIVEDVLRRLQQHATQLASEAGHRDILFTGKLQPSVLGKLSRIADIRVGLQKTIKALQEKSHGGQDKQRFLDIADKTSRRVNRARASENEAPNANQAAKSTESAIVLRDWKIGCALLGSAAEQLLAEQKQRLISTLVSLGSKIVDRQTAFYAKFDFEKARAELLASPEVESFISKFETEAEQKNIRLQFGNLIDVFELAILGQPFYSTLKYLCDQARHRILSTSILKAKVSDGQEAIIRYAWLADLDAKAARLGLRKCIAELPPDPFLRVMLASHFLDRAYWTQWEPEDRKALLDSADLTIRALGLSFPKGKIMRIIGRDAKGDNSEG